MGNVSRETFLFPNTEVGKNQVEDIPFNVLPQHFSEGLQPRLQLHGNTFIGFTRVDKPGGTLPRTNRAREAIIMALPGDSHTIDILTGR